MTRWRDLVSFRIAISGARCDSATGILSSATPVAGISLSRGGNSLTMASGCFPPGRAMRNVYIVAYDVVVDKRRTKVHKLLKGRGDALQYSLFHCALSPTELI